MEDNLKITMSKLQHEKDPLSLSQVEIKENHIDSVDPKSSHTDQICMYYDIKKCSPTCLEPEAKIISNDRCDRPENLEKKNNKNDNEDIKHRSINVFQQQENLYVSMRLKCHKNKEKLSSLKMKKYALAFMLFFFAIYFFISLTLLIGNFYPQDVIESNYKLPFHFLDLWGAFVFVVVETALLIAASMLQFGNLRFFMALINIGLTLIAAILFSFNPDFWEVPSHWIKYSAQIFITLFDFVLISNQFKNKQNILYKYRYYEIAFIVLLLCAAVLKLLIFGSVVQFAEPGEHAAHYFEFVGEMANSLFAFVFTYVLFQECEESLNIMENYEKLDELTEIK